MFDFNKHEVKRCSIREFNNILKSLDRLVYINESAQGKNIGAKVYLWTVISKAYLVFNEFNDKVVTKAYQTDLNDEYDDGYLKDMQSTWQHCARCGKNLKFPKLIKDKSEAVVNASGIIWANSNYNNKSKYIIEYDLHAAWLSRFMVCKLPDTSVKPRKGIVGDNEIGFLKNGYASYGCGDSVVFEGYADYIFPIIYCPNLSFCNKLISEINNSEGVKRKDKKAIFNEWLGSLQNCNPFIRVAVIAQSNQYIIELINKYKNKLVFSVTDSLGAIEAIPELENNIGSGAGQWSIKGEGEMYMDGYNRLYIKDNIITNSVVRGVPKQYLKDLTLDKYKELIKKIDINKNLYRLENKEIVKNG